MFNSHLKKRFINLLPRLTRHHPDTDFGILVNKPLPHRVTVKITDRHDVPVFKPSGNCIYFIAVNPESACF